MIALLDVNVLIALLDKSHVNHVRVASWFITHAPDMLWASCPLTQNGAARIIGLNAYPNPRPTADTLQKLVAVTAHPAHRFWPDDISMTDAALFNPAVVISSNQMTDVYLLGLAVSKGGKLVTTDTRILTSAVIGFQSNHLHVL